MWQELQTPVAELSETKHKERTLYQREDDVIVNYVEKFGTRWSVIAAKLPERTDNEIKNHWHTNLEKCGKKHAVSKGAKRKHVKGEKPFQIENAFSPDSLKIRILESCPITAVSTSESDIATFESPSMENGSKVSSEASVELYESFWTDLFFGGDDYMPMNTTFDNLLVPWFSTPIVF